MNTEIADTILEQMGGAQRLQCMIGAKITRGDSDVTLHFMKGSNGCNHAVIEYNRGPDLYTMKFFKLWRTKLSLLKEVDQVYCDQLVEIFEATTGLYLHF